jgi:hypothetical protein
LGAASVALVAVLAVVGGTWAVVDDLRAPPVWQHSDPTVSALSAVVRQRLVPSDRLVAIKILSHETWDQAAGLALELERQGRRTTVGGVVTPVDPAAATDWTEVFEPRRRPNGRENVDLWLFLTSDPAAVAAAKPAQVLGEAGGVAVAIRRP